MTEYETKDSGQREQFDSGAVRDVRQGKGRYDLISFLALDRIAGVYERGAAKYGDRNYEKGMPISRTLDSALRHIGQYIIGEDDEDHLAQAAWNLIAALHFDEGIKRGLYQSELDDRPRYVRGETLEEVVDRLKGAPYQWSAAADTSVPTRADTEPIHPIWGFPFVGNKKPMGEVQYTSDESFRSQAVLHDPNHSESEGSYHFHKEGDAFECAPADPESHPHRHAKATVQMSLED